MSVTIKTADEIAKMRTAGRLAAEVLEMIEPHVVAGVTTDELDSLLSHVAPRLGRFPDCTGTDLAAGIGQIYPSVFLYVYDPSSSSLLIATSLTGRLRYRETTTVSGSYAFETAGDDRVNLYLLTQEPDGGWPEEAFHRLSAAF